MITSAPLRSPRIICLAWGRIDVKDLGPARDYKLWPGGGRPWDWTETDTHHRPGIQPADVQELLDHGSAVVVLSRGQLRRLQVTPGAMAMLEQAGIPVHVEDTRAAIATYNRLAETMPVGGLFHSTC